MMTAGRRPTIYDVAERAGVSKSLVSLVLRGSPRVSAARREVVLAAIAELGYQPSHAATMLASTRTATIEVLIDDYRNPSFVGIVHGVRQAVGMHGYHVTVTEANGVGDGGVPGRMPPPIPADGRVLAADPRDASLLASSVPLVVAGVRGAAPGDVDLVATDDQTGARLACEHLVGLGHRQIGHLTGAGGPARERRSGFTQAMQAAALDAAISGMSRGTSEEDGYRAATELLEYRPGTTAMVAANDVMALGALAAIRDQGRSVPADISLVGYDDSTIARSRYLDLTSVDDRSEAVGAGAAQALLARIADRSAARVHEIVRPRLVVRGTTAPPRTRAGER